MGFFKNTADSIQADVASGETDRIEAGADALVYALLEGGGTIAQNLESLTREIADGS